MIKKLIVYILVAAMILTVPVSFASTDETFVNVNSVGFFEALGIIDDASYYNAKLDDRMTRAEFAVFVAGLFNTTAYKGSDKVYFKDVEENHLAKDAINLLAQRGIVSGSMDSVFEPDRNIEYSEALLMVLRLLGYDEFVKINGGYPYGCYITVQKHRLFKDADLTNEPTVRNILELLYAAAQENIMEITAIEDKYNTQEVNKEETILSKYFDIYFVEGNLTSDGMVDIKSTVIPERNEIMVDSVKYFSDKDYSEYLGQNVICFYKDVDNLQKRAVYVAPTLLNDVLVINSDDVYGFEDMVYEYKNNSGKTSKIRVNNKMDIIYNYEVVTQVKEDIMLPQNGILKFIDNDCDGTYEVIIIKSYVSFVVNTVNKIKDGVAIHAKDALDIAQINVIADEENDTLIYKKDGTKMECSDIARGQVASVVYVEDNGNLVAKEIIICEDTLYGDLTGYEQDVDSISFLIDDEMYKVTNSFESLAKNVGTRYSANFNLDFFGNIVDVIETDLSMLDLAVGYVIEGYLDTDRSDKTIQMKILTETGKIVTYDVNEKVTIDNTPYNKDVTTAFKYLSKNTDQIAPQLIVYKISEDRKIKYIDTASDFTANEYKNGEFAGEISANYYDRLTKTVPMTANMYYQKEQYSFGGKVTMDNNTKIFVIPRDVAGAEENEFEVIRPSQVEGSLSYEVESYSINNDKITSDVVVMISSSQVMPSSSNAMAITRISKASNANGDETYAIKLIGIKGEQKYITVDESIVNEAPSQDVNDKKSYKLGVGDVVRILTNKNGEINKIALIYDYDTGEIKNGMNFAGTYFSNARSAKASVYRILGEYMQITDYDLSKLSDTQKLGYAKLENQRLSKFTVIVYDKVGGELTFKVGSASDLVAYSDNKNEYSQIVIYTHNAQERVLFVLD